MKTVLVLLALASHSAAQLTPAVTGRVEAAITAAMTRASIPGLSAAAVIGGELRWAAG